MPMCAKTLTDMVVCWGDGGQIRKLCRELRTVARELVDAFGIHEGLLGRIAHEPYEQHWYRANIHNVH